MTAGRSSLLVVRRLAVSLTLACVAAVAIAACGDDEGGKTTTVVETVTTATTTATTGTSTTPGASQSFAAFQSPSKNIGCVAQDGYARCDIRDRDWQPPARPADCDVDYGQGLSVQAGEAATFVCAGDTALDDAAPVLEYGTATKRGLVQCESAQAGITCRDEETGRGFFISRQSYKLL